MLCSYAPRAHVAQWLRQGWRLVPGHIYDPNDWAVVMITPAIPVDLTEEQIEAMAKRFRRPFALIQSGNNRKRGALSGSPERVAARRRGRVYDKVLRRLVTA